MPPPTLWVPRNPSEQLTRRVDIREQDRRACRAVATGLDPDRRCAAASSLLRAGLLSKGARRTMFVVVIEELAGDRFELTAMEHQHPAEALPADDPDEPIGGRVRTRRPDRRGDVPDALRGEHLVEAGGELGISVPDQELRLATLLGQAKLRLRACWVTHSTTGLVAVPTTPEGWALENLDLAGVNHVRIGHAERLTPTGAGSRDCGRDGPGDQQHPQTSWPVSRSGDASEWCRWPGADRSRREWRSAPVPCPPCRSGRTATRSS
jgi:hypothetical protein